jgi:hypothetical protein
MALLRSPSLQRGATLGKCLACMFAVLLASAMAADTSSVEYRIKAAYIFNFAKFVSWPSAAFASADAPIVIGIVGKDPFGSELDQTIAGKTIERHLLQVKRLNETDPVDGCHILFISEPERKRLPEIFEKASQLSILTVGEMDDFTDIGGMIRFFKFENNIRFEVDLKPVEAAGLKISSKLLQVAVVKGKSRK